MTTATDHAVFVREEFRYVEAADLSVRSRNPAAAITLEVDTAHNQSDAQTLANKYLAANNQPRAFQITIEGRQSFIDFAGGPPSFYVDDDKAPNDGKARTQYSLTVDYEANTSTLQVIG